MTVHHPHAPRHAAHPRAIAFFGGSFDPIHSGHMAVALAAQRRFHLDAIYFVPSSRPPHKLKHRLEVFAHRYAMVALACAEHPLYIPSVAEAPADGASTHVYFSIDTVRKFRKDFPDDHLYFILGADSFLEIPTWKSYEALLDTCDFIVASRPGFRIEAIRLVIPPEKLGRVASSDPHTIVLRKSRVHLLTTVANHVSSTEIRRHVSRGQSIHELVPARVEEYILRQALYR